ncbi:MAG: hypothetical protein AAGC57_01105 [Pseudomonadota bacterium]
MKGLAAAVAALLLAGCAAEPVPPPQLPPPPQPPVAVTEIRLAAPPSIARDRVERLAASCWLDQELAAEIMVVDRATGEIVAASEAGELLRIGFAPAGALDTDVRLSGAALQDQARSRRMTGALGRALDGPEPVC